MRARTSKMSAGNDSGSTAVAEPPKTGNASADAAKADRELTLAKEALDKAAKADASAVLRQVRRLEKLHTSGPVFDLVAARKVAIMSEGSTKLAASRAATPIDTATLKLLAKQYKDTEVGASAKGAYDAEVAAIATRKREERENQAKEAQALKNAPPEAVPDYGGGVTEFISIDSIDLPKKKEDRTREFDPDDEEFHNKCQYIRSNETWLQDIIVRPGTEAGRFVLVDGRNRLEANRLVHAEGKVNRARINAKVFKKLDPSAALEVGLMANIRSKRMDKTEIAAAMGVLVARFEGSLRKFAAHVNMNVNTVSNYLAINKVIAEGQKAIAKGEIAASKAYLLGNIPVENQKDWIENAKTMPTQKFIKAVREFLDADSDEESSEGRAARSQATAASAQSAKTHLSPKKVEELLAECCSPDPKAGPRKCNDAFQAGMVAALRMCLGWTPKFGTRANVGYQPKEKADLTELSKK